MLASSSRSVITINGSRLRAEVGGLKVIYTNIRSQVIVKHFLTAPFLATRSVRQQCGIPHPFSLSVSKPQLIKSNSILIEGINIPCTEQRLSMYGDDTTVLVQDGPTANTVIDIFKTYEKPLVSKSRTCIMAGITRHYYNMAIQTTYRRLYISK